MRFWNLDPLDWFLSKSFFRKLIDPSPLGLFVFPFCGGGGLIFLVK